MRNVFKGTKGDATIITLLLAVVVLAVIFFLRVGITVNEDGDTTEKGTSTSGKITHEAELFNLEFESYQQLPQVGRTVKAMIYSVKSSNAKNEHKISIVYKDKEYDENEEFGTLSDLIEDKSSYNVKITSRSEEGFAEVIKIEDVNI